MSDFTIDLNELTKTRALPEHHLNTSKFSFNFLMCIFEIFEKKYFICRLYLLEKFFSLFQALNLNRICLVHSPDKVLKDETKYNHIFYPPFYHLALLITMKTESS